MRPGSGPRAIQNANGAPQLPPAPSGPAGQNQNQPNPLVPQPGVLSSEQTRQQQQQRNDDWAQPPPHPSDRRALTPITERSGRDSNSWDTNTNPPPLHRPGLSTVNGSPLQPDQILKQQSETSQDLPRLQTDTESPTFLGEAIVTSPASHIPPREFGVGQADSAGSFGSKPDPRQSKQEPVVLSKPDQPIHPVQSIFSDIPKTPPRSPHRPAFIPIAPKGPGAESGSPTLGSPSPPLQGTIQRKEGNSPPNSLTVATKMKTPEPMPFPQTGPHPNSPTFSPTPTTANSVPTLTHTTTTTSTGKSEYSGYSDGSKPSPPQYAQGAFSSLDHLNQDSHSYSSQPKRVVQGENLPQEYLPTSVSGSVGGAKPFGKVNGGKEGSGDDHDLMKEAGALYYIQEIQGAAVVENAPVGSRGRSESDEDEREPSTRDAPRPLPRQTQTQSQPPQSLPPRSSPLQPRRPPTQAFLPPPPPPPLPVSTPQHPAQPSPYPSQNRYQAQDARGHEQQQILAPQPQQPVTSSFNPVETMQGDIPSSNLHRSGNDANNTSPVVDSRRTSVIGQGGQVGGSRPGMASRPSGARDPVLKQRAGTNDSASSHSHHNAQPQPRHPLPPHPESPRPQLSQSPRPTHTQPPRHQGRIPTQTLQVIETADRYPVNMANVDNANDNSDALVALTFLERDEASARKHHTPPVQVTPSETMDDVSQDSGSYEGKYRSSFAPSKQATQRLAKTQAQQAAHQVAVHRPGKSGGMNGKGKRRQQNASWEESSEEEEEDDEDDEDVDSDGDPVSQRRSQGPGAGQNLGKISARGSPYGSSTDLNHHGQGKLQRGLPRPPSPSRSYGVSFLPDKFLSS